MALLPGYRYLDPNEIITHDALVDLPNRTPGPSACAGFPAAVVGFYMVPIGVGSMSPPGRRTISYMPPETSLKAKESQKTKAPADRVEILGYIAGRVGATCDEVEVALGMVHQTTSARVRDLAKARMIRDSGTRRKTRTGCKAIVWETVPPE